MKTSKLILFLLFFVFSGPSWSQNFHGGVMAGMAGSQVAGDTYSGFKKAGIFAGGFVSWDFTKRSALQLELEYFQKGSRKNPDSTNYDSYIFRANYIELPILYQFSIDWFTIEAGPSAGILFGHYEEKNSETLSDLNGYNKPARMTLQINLGFRFRISQKFGFDFRTNNSLLNIRSKNVTGDVWRLWTYGQFHDVLVLSFFYQFK